MPFALFRADASPDLGIGHVMRCLVLADALADAGWTTGFATAAGTVATATALAASRHPVLTLAPDTDVREALNRQWPDGCDLLVVDHYGLDRMFENSLRPWARRVLVIDDLADRDHDADLLLDSTLGRHEADYRKRVADGCRLLLGPDYALLRAQFVAARPAALARRGGEALGRVLVSLGGTDPHGVAALVLEGVARSGVTADVDVVFGSGDEARARAAAEDIVGGVRFLRAVENMAGLMASADLAVGAGGVTTWERCCLGLPSLIVTVAANQEVQAEAVARRGAAVLLGRHGDITTQDIATGIASLARDSRRRREMAQTAASLCDGRGVERLIAAVTAP